MNDRLNEAYDVVVVGGGAAGLSGAVALSRARRTVLVVDAGDPRNAPSDHVHDYLGREGAAPAELLASGRAELAGYGGSFATGRVTGAAKDGEGFVVTVTSADAGTHAVRARRLLLTTGLTDELPRLPGLAERFGKDVLHCPYCHGWEVRDRAVGILGTGPLAWHHAELWRQWTDRVLVLRHEGLDAPDADQAERLAARGIHVVDGPVTSLESADDRLTGVRLASGEVVALDALVVAPRLTARAELPQALGLPVVPVEYGGQVVGSRVPADATGATEVPGVWVAGNLTDPTAQVVVAAAAGLRAGAMINADLIAADTRDAVAAHREQLRTMFEQEAWEERYRSRPTLWSGNPNPQLVAEAADLTPGRALDVGSGEGADAIWLASRGWQVTGTDISTVALARATDHARAAGADIAERITFSHADLRETPPAPGSFDLVTAQFMHLPTAQRRALFAALAAAVAPDGTLLLVGHHPRDKRDGGGPGVHLDMLYTPEQVAADLDPALWDVRTDTRARRVVDPEGRELTLHDAVTVARRRR
ncbi:bifunctional NAD(P)/FAD-dependent oxidoreductase/class I SAM-dependent methyltransferase [Streptacidiphilus jiangxiensis]|uniref:Thioredoxin reductase n=1 Tax=Streptacidiphilus jiangxiensis TaxID=235985 RepID=A0A1H7V881_STRJI|nr:bifunctional NAD(P)/FAD-dependent oxidoreductase/class I SAM-dependent methyltransferase [Streptacidiphilus jiangxiensis]SEM04967.1 Thioredoxin reductase [Streptacidiphilus jiangxiensis]